MLVRLSWRMDWLAINDSKWLLRSVWVFSRVDLSSSTAKRKFMKFFSCRSKLFPPKPWWSWALRSCVCARNEKCSHANVKRTRKPLKMTNTKQNWWQKLTNLRFRFSQDGAAEKKQNYHILARNLTLPQSAGNFKTKYGNFSALWVEELFRNEDLRLI